MAASIPEESVGNLAQCGPPETAKPLLALSPYSSGSPSFCVRVRAETISSSAKLKAISH